MCSLWAALDYWGLSANSTPSNTTGWRSGNIILHRLSEISTEIEITAEGGIMAKIPGQEIEVKGMLCLSILTNMHLRR